MACLIFEGEKVVTRQFCGAVTALPANRNGLPKPAGKIAENAGRPPTEA
jgi:hypothetical protein